MSSAESVILVKCWRSLVGVTRMDRVKNEDVNRMVVIEREYSSWVE